MEVDGLGVSFSLQSFAARALIGSLVAVALAACAARYGWVRSGRARRTLVLAPVAAAAAAAVACLAPGSSFLPALVVSADTGQSMEIFGAPITVRRLEWLLVGYVAVATFLLLRRAVGHWAINRYVRDASPSCDVVLSDIVRTTSRTLGITAPPVLLVARCPGGAFTTGIRRPVVALDPVLLDTLDERELEGLLAHELAHIARRDVAINVVVGIVRDLTFFVPPLHLAYRWLRHEQEHSADDLASDSTGRPAALASSILKVWERSSTHGRRQIGAIACATMTPVPLPVGVPVIRRVDLGGGAREIAERVVRLIDRAAPVSLRRQRAEMALAMSAVILATGVTVVLPAQMDAELLIAQWARPLDRAVESPAMASFRAMTPPAALPAAVATDTATTATSPATSGASPAASGAACATCLLLESSAEWNAQALPTPPDRAPVWHEGRPVWQAAPEGLPAAPSAQTLWGVDGSSSRVGFFLVQPQDR